MKCFERNIRVLACLLTLLVIMQVSAKAQIHTKKYQVDSTITESSDGSISVEYAARPFDFGPIQHPTASELKPLSFSEEEKSAFMESWFAAHDASLSSRKNAPRRVSPTELSNYAVGEIPMQEGMTPTGARTYQIPIPTAPGFKLTPAIAIAYNSQAGEGWAGYGWDIQGLSSIALISKNMYYHAKAKGANVNDTDAVFALDGVPLVRNTQSGTSAAFPLITATGNILVAPNYNSQGYVTSFNVKYPNGATAQFGIGTDVAYNMPSYPIKEMADIEGNKITFVYSSYTYDGIDRLTAIRYGYNSSGTYKGEITFSYSYNSGYSTKYYAGKSVYRNYRLTGITSKNNGEVLYQYTLAYEQKDNVWLLTQVNCMSGGESLRPLVFEYGSSEYDYQPTDGYLYKDSNPLLLLSAFTSDDHEFIYRRGKFVTSSFNDGVLIYPYFDNYGVTGGYKPFLGAWRYQFGSLYPADQVILFAPSLSDFNDVDNSLITGSGFQTIEAVDVDGDGLDELVKVNFNGTSGSNTKLLITIYKCGTTGSPVQNAQFEVQVQGTITSGEYVSPYRREYYWGDFRGNGKIQLLTVAYDKNYNDTKLYDQTSYAALIDLSSHTKLCDAKLFDFTSSNCKGLLSSDIDNDSKTELCFATSSGLDVYRLQSTSFSKEKTLGIVTSPVLTSETRPYYITDLNGDGYIDIMVAPAAGSSTAWSRYAFNGASFSSSTIYLTSRTADDTFMFIDLNHDGLSDLVKISGTTLGTYTNKNGSSFSAYSQSPSTIENTKGIIPSNIVDYSGMSSFIKIDGFFIYEFKYSRPSPKLRSISKSIDGMGRMLVNSYVYLPSNSRYWTDNSLTVNNSSGYAFRTLPIYVLESENGYLSENSYTDLYKNKYYSYFNGVVHNLGLGFCGFSKIRSYDYLSGSATEIVEEVHDTQKRGVVTSIVSRHGSVWNDPYHIVTNTYDNNSTTYGKLNPRLTKSVENNTLTGIETTTSYTYGSYDLPTTILTSRRIGTGTAQTEKLVRTYENSVSTSKYVLGVVKEESVVKEGDGSISLAWKERSVNTYDSFYRPLTNRRYVGRYGTIINRPIIHPIRDSLILHSNAVGTISDDPIILEPKVPLDPEDPWEPGIPIDPTVPIDTATFHPFEPIADIEHYNATNLVSETQWEYDNWGNVISEKSASYGATEYVGNTYTYDINGRYMLSKTDALGHMTTYSGYNKFGKPTTVKDYRNRTTTFAYDAWGNLVTTTSPDGTVEQTTVAWGGAGLYTVTRTATGKPETVIHYDALSREIRSGVKRFDGQWQWVDKEYDSKGRLSRTSLPYRGNGASYWNTYSYDDYGRPVSLVEASGKTSTWSYSGTSVTTVKDGISSTSTTDANGNVVSVTDPGGTITYTLRDDGQPSKIIAPGNVTTSFTYDDYGRRTKIIDPSAGTQTDAYVWNTDGSSVYTHTNPNGTVKTYKDKYGRTTLVERPGEYDTAYTYDTYGRLDTEQSTNGTGMEYTYDGLDRVVTTKETIPDGKWLRKVYSYGTAGILNSIRYVSQSGQITTESYTYSNGHNTGISLPDGTVVWSLTSENDLGMVTAIASGGITREYGFTAFGMPTYRKMDGGDLQDYTYNFDVATGNLLSRSDSVNGQTETFGYDNLNRLVAIGSRQVSYDNKGNILSIDGVGLMNYGSAAHPYRITTLLPEDDGLVPDRQQSISYTCYNRPSILTEGGRSAAFTYNGDGGRVKMYVADGATPVLSRYYIGGRYECDQTPSGSKERLYLGGDAYSAPMVLQRENSGSWTAYNIGRDYLGNITQIATLDGTLIAEYSYDPWGRLRNPETLEIYASGSAPELFLGRGFTGHEHLTWFGLVNMNARLYDPLLGRFLSPDPYVQAPDFTQNFNRYSYALNNPLKYTDESGEFVVTSTLVIGCIIAGAAIIGGTVNVLSNLENINGFWQGFTTALTGAIGGAGVAAAGIFSGGSALLFAGAGAGALTSFNNSVVAQTGKNFSGINQLDWNTVAKLTISGAVAGTVSAYAGSYVSTSMPLWFNGTFLTSPIEKAVAASLVSSAAGHIVAGTTYGILAGESFEKAFFNSFNGIGQSIAMGVAIGVSSTLGTCLLQGINPFEGVKAFPPKKGFNGVPIDDTLEPGTVIDRYGSPNGRFAAPEGTSFSERGLPLVSKAEPYNCYQVMKPIPVQSGTAAGSFWFASPGGGTQFFFPEHNIQYYIDNGYLSPL